MNTKVILPNPKRFKSWWAQCLTEAYESGTTLDLTSYRQTHPKYEWVNRRQCLNLDYFNVPEVLRDRMQLRLTYDLDYNGGLSVSILDPSGSDILARTESIDIIGLYMGCSNIFEFIGDILKPITEQVDMHMTGATLEHKKALRFAAFNTSTLVLDVLHRLDESENYEGSKFKGFLSEFIFEAGNNNVRKRLELFGDFSYYHSLDNERNVWVQEAYLGIKNSGWLGG